MRYDLEHVIGKGGMGQVYLGWVRGEHGFSKRVAVKRIRPDLVHDGDFVARLVAEAKLTVTLEHANIVQVLDLGRHDDELFLVMELVDGADLSRIVRALKKRTIGCPIAIAVLVAVEVTKGLVFAHERTAPDGTPAGIIHCDISPSNVLVSYSGEVKLADFGIAQAWSDGGARQSSVLGKLRYMPPERKRGEPPTPQTDLYALGVLLNDLIQLPSMARSPSQADTATTAPLPEEIPPPLRGLVDRLCAPVAAERPARARDVLAELVRIQRLVEPITSAELGQWVRALVPPVVTRPPASQRDAAAVLHRLVGARVGARRSQTETHEVPPPETPETEAPEMAETAAEAPRPLKARSFGVDGVDASGTVRWRALPSEIEEEGTALRTRDERRRWVIAGSVTATAVVGLLALVVVGRVRTPAAAPQPTMAAPIAPPAAPAPVPPAPTTPPPPTTAAPPTTEAADVAPSQPPPRHHAPDRRHARVAPTPSTATATLSIYTDPWAHVFVDGAPHGTTPLARLLVRPGRHVIRLERPDMAPFTKIVDVAAAEAKVVDLELPHAGAR
jgi:serine/threonine protein kinase